MTERTHGLVIAAGGAPIPGDINVDEDLNSYARVSEMLQPLLPEALETLHGPFAKPEVIVPWRQRLEYPRGRPDAGVSHNCGSEWGPPRPASHCLRSGHQFPLRHRCAAKRRRDDFRHIDPAFAA